jgi:hypothetical protein
MIRRATMLRVEWEAMRGAFLDVPEEHLVGAAMARGAALLRGSDEPSAGDPSTSRRVEFLRPQVVHRAAAVAAYRHRLVVLRDRLRVARTEERQSYEQGILLDRDLVPPFKLRAKELRAEIRRLESVARAHGLDPDTIEPAVDWAETLAVDTFEAPRYESDADRKRTAVEFFRRHG